MLLTRFLNMPLMLDLCDNKNIRSSVDLDLPPPPLEVNSAPPFFSRGNKESCAGAAVGDAVDAGVTAGFLCMLLLFYTC